MLNNESVDAIVPQIRADDAFFCRRRIFSADHAFFFCGADNLWQTDDLPRRESSLLDVMRWPDIFLMMS